LSMLPVATEVAPAMAAAGFWQENAWLLVAAPLVSAGILLLLGRSADRWGHWLGLLASTLTFVVGAGILVDLLGSPAGERVREVDLFSWISTSELDLVAGLRLDPLSLTFVLLVTFVGSL